MDDWDEYMNFKCSQIEKKFRDTYLYRTGKVPLFEQAGFDGIDLTIEIPKSYEEWLSLYKK